MHDILPDMLLWMTGFLCISAALFIAARAFVNHMQKRAKNAASADARQ